MSEKTEKASQKKKNDERKKGHVSKSRELLNAMTFAGVTLLILTMADTILGEFQELIKYFLNVELSQMLTSESIEYVFTKAMLSFAKTFLPIGLVILAIGVIGNIIQTGFLLTLEPLKPSFSKLNPISGLKNMFSLKALGVLVKSCVVVVVLSYVGYLFISKNFFEIINIGNVYFPYLLNSSVEIIQDLFSLILVIVAIIGVVDFVYQKFTYNKQIMMTKQEVKEEFKQMEGDPFIKGKIKQKQRQMSAQRMMQAVPSATVIITNPTHLSLAIRYEKGVDTAPVLVAKGADHVAMKIREIAKEHDIPIIENKPLARMIYKQVEIDQEIPAEMYQMVAEVLVAVYKLKNKKMYKKI